MQGGAKSQAAASTAEIIRTKTKDSRRPAMRSGVHTTRFACLDAYDASGSQANVVVLVSSSNPWRTKMR